jgi:hypothetical protein
MALAALRAMADYLLLLLCGVAAVMISYTAGAANDDGFIWIDANTRIKVMKPVSAAAGETKAPQPKTEKKEKPKK